MLVFFVWLFFVCFLISLLHWSCLKKKLIPSVIGSVSQYPTYLACHHRTAGYPAFIRYHPIPTTQYPHLLSRGQLQEVQKNRRTLLMIQKKCVTTGQHRFLWQHLSLKLQTPRQHLGGLVLVPLPSKMMISICKLLTSSWLILSKPPYLHSNFQKKFWEHL